MEDFKAVIICPDKKKLVIGTVSLIPKFGAEYERCKKSVSDGCRMYGRCK
jgi:hypothetical protein